MHYFRKLYFPENKGIRAIAFALYLAAPFSANASDAELEQQLKTAYISADFGASTYKSKLELQNDTAYTTHFTLGAYVGAAKDVNIRLVRDMATINFELNTGSLKPVWSQTAITYRLGYFYFGPVMGSVAMEATKDGLPLFTMTGTGYGGATGIMFPASKSTVLHLDVLECGITQIQEKEQKDVTFGPRLSADIGASVDLTKKVFDFIFGYRYTKHTITYEGTANAELMTTTYLGFAMGFDF